MLSEFVNIGHRANIVLILVVKLEVFLLSLYPVMSTYKVLSEKNSN